MTFNKDMMKVLRQLGFRRWEPTRHQDGDCAIYERWDEARFLDVQLWEDGAHRVSHMLFVDGDRRRLRGSTPPTGFRTLEEMLVAIDIEATRTDHPAP